MSDIMPTKKNERRTYVDVEIGVINIKTVNGLFKIDMGNTIVSNVVVSGDSELSIGHNFLYKCSCSF